MVGRATGVRGVAAADPPTARRGGVGRDGGPPLGCRLARPSDGRGDPYRQLFVAAHRARVQHEGALSVHLPIRVAPKGLLDGDPPSRRARAAPRQKWIPYPKVRWWSILRSMSKRSGSANRRSSRPADAVSRSILESSGTRCPWRSTSFVTHRPCTGEGASNRSSSSTAPGIREGSAASSARWSGYAARVDPAKPIRRATVSVPALTRRMPKPHASSSVRHRVVPSSSTISPARDPSTCRRAAGHAAPPAPRSTARPGAAGPRGRRR